MNSFHFTLGSSRVPRVRWFTGLQCGNPWFIANTLACHCAIPDTMVAYAPCPACPKNALYSFSVSSPSSLPSLLGRTFAGTSSRVGGERRERWRPSRPKPWNMLSAYDVGGGSSEPIIPCSATIYLCARNTLSCVWSPPAHFVIRDVALFIYKWHRHRLLSFFSHTANFNIIYREAL